MDVAQRDADDGVAAWGLRRPPPNRGVQVALTGPEPVNAPGSDLDTLDCAVIGQLACDGVVGEHRLQLRPALEMWGHGGLGEVTR